MKITTIGAILAIWVSGFGTGLFIASSHDPVAKVFTFSLSFLSFLSGIILATKDGK